MIFVYGWNAVAEFIADELAEKSMTIEGILVDQGFAPPGQETPFAVIPVADFDFHASHSVYNCIGYRNLQRRTEIGEMLGKARVLKSFISDRASIHGSAKIGEGAVILGDVVVERGANIGDHALLWGGSRVCHDSSVGPGCFLAAGSIVGGYASVGPCVAIGFNSSIKEKSRIPAHVKTGANRYISGDDFL